MSARDVDKVFADFIDKAAELGFDTVIERRYNTVRMAGSAGEVDLEMLGDAYKVKTKISVSLDKLPEVSRALAKTFLELKVTKSFYYAEVEIMVEGFLRDAEPAETLAYIAEKIGEALGSWPP